MDNRFAMRQRLSVGQFLDSRSVEGEARNLRKKDASPHTRACKARFFSSKKNKNVNRNERACIEYEPIRQSLSVGQIFDSRSVEGEEWVIDLP